MCPKLTNAQHYVQTGYAEFQPNRSINAGRVDRHAFTTLCELTPTAPNFAEAQNYSIDSFEPLRYRNALKYGLDGGGM